MHKICLVYADTKADREDLYQEMILQLWKSYSSFQEKSRFSTWMYRVALNTAITTTKKATLFKSQRRTSPVAYELEESMDYSEDVRILYRAISQLNKVEKAIILLWLEEKSYQEIAQSIGMSVKNVSVKLVRIKNKLAKLIKMMS